MSEDQNYLRLNNGNRIPKIGVGTYLMRDKLILQTIISEAFKIGYRLIDTAKVYQNEGYIGEIMSNLSEYNLKREDVFLTTKLSPADQGRGRCREAILGSMERLKVSYIDMVLIHFPGTSRNSPESEKNPQNRHGSWEDLEDLYKEGLLKNIGVSNYTERHLNEMLLYAKVKPVVNQIEVHPLYHKKDLIDFCQGNDIVVQAYSSLGAQEGWPVLSVNETLKKIAKKYQRPVSQILLRWALQHNLCIIPKTNSVERLRSNYEVLEFKIDSQDMDAIDNLNENRKFCWDPENVR